MLKKVKVFHKESSGVIFLKVHPPSIDSIYFSLKKLFKNVSPSEFKGRLFVVSPFSFKIWPKRLLKINQ